ncbi:MAG: toxin-antitoxin system HicB family antitoxin [Actinomycetota bacterium]|nr:toxin-antitoxin system HicB family antitoxin [Actinomycetota bacterium]
MKQLITRIDDDLHRRLKERAAEQDRSLNDLVRSVLEGALADDAATIRRRIEASGLRVVPPRPGAAPSREAVIESLRGCGPALTDALAADRAAR